MTSPEEHGVFRMADRTHPWTEKGVTHVSPPPESAQKEEKPSWIRRLTRSLALRLFLAGAAITGAGYGADKAYDDVPAIHQAVDNLLHRGESTEITVPSDTFSNEADKGTIGAENTIALSLEEIEQKFPQQIVEDRENYTATILFPFKAPPEGIKIEYAKIVFNAKANALTPDQDVMIHASETPLPKGTEIFSPIDGRIALARDPNDKSKITAVSFFYYDKKNDTTYFISIGPRYSPSPYFSILEPSMETLPDTPATTNWESYPTIKRGTPIMTTAQDQPVSMLIVGFKGKEIDRIKTGGKTARLISPQFFTEVSSGVEKLIVIGNA